MPDLRIEDLPSEALVILQARATAEGLCLEDYLRRRLVEHAAHPSLDEAFERRKPRRGGVLSAAEAAESVREDRDRR